MKKIILSLALLALTASSAWAQTKSENTHITKTRDLFITVTAPPQPTDAARLSYEYAGKELFVVRPNGSVELDESLRGACSPDKLLEALILAEKEFVSDENQRPVRRDLSRPWLDPAIVFETWPNERTTIGFIDNRTAAEKLRDQAKELERKSEAAQKIRQIVKDCSPQK
jgi:hypothetical protein